MSLDSTEQQLANALEQNARLQAALQVSNEARQQLQQEVERATSAMQSAAEELQGFVYAASHDVKEALRSVSSYSQLLARQASAGDQKDGRDCKEFIYFITEGVKTAVAILDRLNAFSRIESAPATTSINLSVPVQMAVMKLHDSVRQSGAQIASHGLPDVVINEAQFTTLFENLLDNAIRYRESAPLKVEITSEERDDGYEISVRDNGCGIPAEYQQLIFRPFKRLHPKKVAGIGLGLAVCQKIAAAHGGRISVESDGRTGSTFKIFLPF